MRETSYRLRTSRQRRLRSRDQLAQRRPCARARTQSRPAAGHRSRPSAASYRRALEHPRIGLALLQRAGCVSIHVTMLRRSTHRPLAARRIASLQESNRPAAKSRRTMRSTSPHGPAQSPQEGHVQRPSFPSPSRIVPCRARLVQTRIAGLAPRFRNAPTSRRDHTSSLPRRLSSS